MGTQTDLGRDPLPSDSDLVLVPAHFKAYADAIAHKVIHTARDQADRDVLYGAFEAPVFVLLDSGMFSVKLVGPPVNTWVDLSSASGVVTGNITPLGDWDFVNGFVEKVNSRIVHINITMRRKTSDLVSSDVGGNIVDTPAFQIGAGFIPRKSEQGMFRSTYSDGAIDINSANGVVTIISGNNKMTIQKDTNVTFTATYTVAT